MYLLQSFYLAGSSSGELWKVIQQFCLICWSFCRPYLPGWRTMIESDTFPKGLDENVVRAISAKKNEPDWMLDFRLKAFKKWLSMAEPAWSDNSYPTINYQVWKGFSEKRCSQMQAYQDLSNKDFYHNEITSRTICEDSFGDVDVALIGSWN